MDALLADWMVCDLALLMVALMVFAKAALSVCVTAQTTAARSGYEMVVGSVWTPADY